MPEYDDDLDNDAEPDEDQDQGVRGARRAQRATEKENQRLREEVAQAASERRELAALRAGLDPADKQSAFFLKHYDGELTADAMKAAAIEAGVIPEVDPATAEVTAASNQMASAYSGGQTGPQGTTYIGPQQVEVPADETEMWTEFEKKASTGDFQAAQDVLRRYGRQDANLIGGNEMISSGPATTPLNS